MGKGQEPQILAGYQKNGHSDLPAQRAGFLVDKEYGWLGASPDAVVIDDSGKGCAEIKTAV